MTDQSPIILTRASTAAPASWDPEKLTVTAVIATTTPVRRHDAAGPYAEILLPSGLDLDAVDEFLPLYDAHRGGTSRATIGRVQNVRIEGDTIVADLRLSAADDVEPIRQRIADGTISHTSVGYRVTKWAETREGAQRIKRAVAWSLVEVSLVPDPADRNARIRSESAPDATARSGGNPDNRAGSKGASMPDDTQELERQRRAEIRQLCRSAGLSADLADGYIDDGLTVDQVKAAAFDALSTRSAPVIRTHTPANDSPEMTRSRQADALAYRMGALPTMPDASREFAEMSLLDLARDAVSRSGVSVRGMSRDEILHRASHTTSDFALTVSAAVAKTAMQSYAAAESPLKKLAKSQVLRDFKPSTAIRLGELGALEELPESGEFTSTTRGEQGESLSLKTYGRRIDLSRNLIVNDDLHLLADTTAAFGAAAAQTEADLLCSTLTSNPLMSDGIPVFDASRGNLENTVGNAFGDIGVLVFDDARRAMRKFTGIDGKTLLNITPKYIVTGAGHEFVVEKYLSTIYPATSSDANPFAGKLELLVEPRLGDGHVYVFADPARVPLLRLAHLAGAEGPVIQRQDAWDTLGLSFRAWLDVGVGILDWRGGYLNADPTA